jgi:hypothetical protein
MRVVRWLICLLTIPAMTAALGAQEPQRRRILPELRADVMTGDVVSAQMGAGVHITSGTYARVALLGGYGRAWNDEQDGASYRMEVQGRFHLDPLRTTRFGLYGIGGIVTSHDPFANWQSRLVLGAGVELPAYARATLAVEAALAGGLRLSVATRRVPLGRR